MADRPYLSSLRFMVGLLPTRRLLAVDAGSQTVKLLVLEEVLGRRRVRVRKLLDPANEVGVITVWNRRSGRFSQDPGLSEPSFEIHDFYDLREILRQEFAL